MKGQPFHAICLAALLMCGVGAGPATAAELRVSVPKRVVVGLPLVVTFEVRGPGELLHSRPWSVTNPFDLQLEGQDHTLAYGAVQQRERWMGPPGRLILADEQGHVHEQWNKKNLPVLARSLAEDETVVAVVDLTLLGGELEGREVRMSRATDARRLEPGSYRLTVTDAPQNAVEYVNRVVELRAPNEAEADLLGVLAELNEPRGWYAPGRVSAEPTPWELLVTRHPQVREQVDLDGLSPLGRRQLAYYLLLAELVHDERPIAELEAPEQAIEQALPAWRASMRLLQFEIAAARDDAQALANLRRQILDAAPQWAELLEQVEQEGGRIRHYRELVPEAEHEQ